MTLVVGSTTAGHTFPTTINGKTITYTAGSGETTSTIAAAIQALLAASTAPEFQEVSWTVDAATITGTANTPGKPFTVSEGGTGTYTLTTTVASSGPNHADLAGNWSLGTVPAATDAVLIDGGPDLLYGLENLSAAAYASFTVKASFAGKIGLPFRDEAGGYVQYRGRKWPVDDGVAVTIGEGDGTGPTLVNLTLGSVAAVTVLKTGNRSDPAVPAVNLAGCSSGTLTVAGGDVGVAADDPTLSATLTTATLGDATLTVGPGGTVTTLNQKGGAAVNYGATPTANVVGGTYDLYGTAATAVTADPAPDAEVVVRWLAGGTIGTATFRGQTGAPAPKLDCSADPRAKTLTNCTFTGGAVLFDPDKLVTFTNAGTFDRASLAASDLGARFTLART